MEIIFREVPFNDNLTTFAIKNNELTGITGIELDKINLSAPKTGTILVNKVKITSENISNKLLEYFEEEGELDNVRTRTPELAFNPRPYYTEVLCKAGLDDDHRVFDTERDFPGEFKTLGRTLVYTWKSSCITQGRDSIVYMRNNNMAIEVKRGLPKPIFLNLDRIYCNNQFYSI